MKRLLALVAILILPGGFLVALYVFFRIKFRRLRRWLNKFFR